jgi:hypothetical protein
MRESEEDQRTAPSQTTEAEGLAGLIRQLKIVERQRYFCDPDSFVRIRKRNSECQHAAQQDARDHQQAGRHCAVMVLSAVALLR